MAGPHALTNTHRPVHIIQFDFTSISLPAFSRSCLQPRRRLPSAAGGVTRSNRLPLRSIINDRPLVHPDAGVRYMGAETLGAVCDLLACDARCAGRHCAVTPLHPDDFPAHFDHGTRELSTAPSIAIPAQQVEVATGFRFAPQGPDAHRRVRLHAKAYAGPHRRHGCRCDTGVRSGLRWAGR